MRALHALVANVCSDDEAGARIEKVKLKKSNFKMDGRGSAGKAPLKMIEQEEREITEKEVICGSVCSCSRDRATYVPVYGRGICRD